MKRKTLSADGMISLLKNSFSKIPEHRKSGKDEVLISMEDCLLTSYAAFSLKYESFNRFFKEVDEEESKRVSVQNLFQVNRVPSTKRLKEIIDPVETKHLRPAYNNVFRELQRGGVLKNYLFLDKYYVLALDGTQYFSSDAIHCDSCLKTVHKSGKVTYSHQMLAGCIVHPTMKQVIPVAPEPIQNGDGSSKNDCERNAAKRFLEKFRNDHPKLNVIVTEDGLASNAPHIRELQKHNMRFILGVKPGDHKYLFDWVNALDDMETITTYHYKGKKVIRRITQTIEFANQVPLNDSNHDLLVNFLKLTEVVERKIEKYGDEKDDIEWVVEGKPTTFSWVTDIEINRDNAFTIMQGGRKRWAIENETFNCLKNQGYNLDRNYGHGKENLATNFAFLMMLAFLIDQVQELCCSTFQKVFQKLGRKKYLWNELRSIFKIFTIKTDWHGLFTNILNPPKREFNST